MLALYQSSVKYMFAEIKMMGDLHGGLEAPIGCTPWGEWLTIRTAPHVFRKRRKVTPQRFSFFYAPRSSFVRFTSGALARARARSARALALALALAFLLHKPLHTWGAEENMSG